MSGFLTTFHQRSCPFSKRSIFSNVNKQHRMWLHTWIWILHFRISCELLCSQGRAIQDDGGHPQAPRAQLGPAAVDGPPELTRCPADWHRQSQAWNTTPRQSIPLGQSSRHKQIPWQSIVCQMGLLERRKCNAPRSKPEHCSAITFVLKWFRYESQDKMRSFVMLENLSQSCKLFFLRLFNTNHWF